MEESMRLVVNVHEVQVYQIASLAIELILRILNRWPEVASVLLPLGAIIRGRAIQIPLQTLGTATAISNLIASSLSESALQARLGRPHDDD